MVRAAATFLLSLFGLVTAATAAPVLRSAEAQITITSRTSCDVRLSLTVDGAPEVEHRLAVTDGSRVELVEVHGAQQAERRTVGATEALVLRPGGPSYGFHYRVAQSESVRDRCPIWLPTVPADGRTRAVRFDATLPDGSAPGASMPAFTWTGTHGTTTIAHLPAIVRIAYAAEGEPRGWNISAVIDALAIGTFAVATAIWALRVRR